MANTHTEEWHGVDFVFEVVYESGGYGMRGGYFSSLVDTVVKNPDEWAAYTPLDPWEWAMSNPPEFESLSEGAEQAEAENDRDLRADVDPGEYRRCGWD